MSVPGLIPGINPPLLFRSSAILFVGTVSSASSTIDTVQAIHAIYKSCESGKWIRVGESTISSMSGKYWKIVVLVRIFP